MSYIERLKEKWNIHSGFQFIIILVVFACTGTTVLFLKIPYNAWLDDHGGSTTLTSVLYFIFIWPTYYIILLFYGFVFGQFSFFWNFAKKTWGRIFRRKSVAEGNVE